MGDDTYRSDFSAGEVEAIIKRVRGVLAVKVIAEEGEISEIHILAERERNPKQIVRDIESALLVQSGKIIDHKKISVVQMEKEQALVTLIPAPVLSSINISSVAGQMTIKVEVRIEQSIYVGEVIGPVTRSNSLRLSARAGAQAVEQYLQESCFVIEDVRELEIAHRPIVLVAVDFVTQGGREKLLGAVYIEGDRLEAAALAVLQAVSKTLPLRGESR